MNIIAFEDVVRLVAEADNLLSQAPSGRADKSGQKWRKSGLNPKEWELLRAAAERRRILMRGISIDGLKFRFIRRSKMLRITSESGLFFEVPFTELMALCVLVNIASRNIIAFEEICLKAQDARRAG